MIKSLMDLGWVPVMVIQPNPLGVKMLQYGTMAAASTAGSSLSCALKNTNPYGTGFVMRGPCRSIADTAAIYALSFSQSNGWLYWRDILLASWNPSQYTVFCATDTTLTLFGSSIVSYYYGGVGSPTANTTSSGMSIGYAYTEINASRSATGVASVGTYLLSLGIINTP